MSWLIEDVIRREYGQLRYQADGWWRFCSDHGLQWLTTPLPPEVPALVINDTIILNENLRGTERDFHAWHEISHWVLHAGDERFLRTLPCGWMIRSKQERQATEFALRYPVWDPETAHQIARERGLVAI